MHSSFIVSLTHELHVCHLWQITTGNVQNHFRSVRNAKHVCFPYDFCCCCYDWFRCFSAHCSSDNYRIQKTAAKKLNVTGIIMMIRQHQCHRLCVFDAREHWKRVTESWARSTIEQCSWMWKVRVSKRKERKINAYFFVAAVASATHFLCLSPTHTPTWFLYCKYENMAK